MVTAKARAKPRVDVMLYARQIGEAWARAREDRAAEMARELATRVMAEAIRAIEDNPHRNYAGHIAALYEIQDGYKKKHFAERADPKRSADEPA